MTAPLLFAHRGVSAHETENTIAAFERARRDGADGVELDVLRCGSGEVVVFHDDDLRRLAGRPGRVRELTLRELRAVRLLAGGEIPTLDEALDAIGDDLIVNVELKASRAWHGQRLAPAVAKLLRRRGRGRFVISSFSPLALVAFRRVDRVTPTGLLFEPQSRRPLRDAWGRRLVPGCGVHPHHSLVSAERVARWRRERRQIRVWTVDDAAELRRLVALGVDAIICNDPAEARALIA